MTRTCIILVTGAQDVGRSTGKGYQKLETADPGDKSTTVVPPSTDKIDKELSESSDDSDNSDEDDSDSECGRFYGQVFLSSYLYIYICDPFIISLVYGWKTV